MKAVICGAGIAGLALAKQLGEAGWDVVVLEAAPGPRHSGYMIDFFGPGYDAAEAMGLLPRFEELSYPVAGAHYVDAAGRSRASSSLAPIKRAMHGRYLNLMRPDIERALREALGERVRVCYGTSLTGIQQDDGGVRVTLTDSSAVDADLLIGADGVHSLVRSMVFGEESRFLYYLGYHTAAYIFEDPEISRTLQDSFYQTDTLRREMGFYRLRDGSIGAFAAHRGPDPRLPDDLRRALRAEYSSLGWIVPRALEECPPGSQVYYDQVAQIRMPAWSTGRVALLGDSCFAVSLLAGQGASLGIAGAYLLADRLTRTESIPQALADFERTWRPVAESAQRRGQKSVRGFIPTTRVQLWVRRLALRLVNVPWLARFVVGAYLGKMSGVIRATHARHDRG